MNRQDRRAFNASQRAYSPRLERVSFEHSDPSVIPPGLCEVWRSRDFLVQVFEPKDGAQRISVNRVEIGLHRFTDGITWDEMQHIKRQLGRGDTWAVEVFPVDDELVNVANMRHLFLLQEPPSFAWRKGGPR